LIKITGKKGHLYKKTFLLNYTKKALLMQSGTCNSSACLKTQ